MDLDAKARDILRRNDRGGHTVPTASLYPFQWNWDSAFTALGFATFDLDRAWRELESLAEGTWDNGMWPHILFRHDDPDYFPGPSVWRAGAAIPSSGITQPPVAAIAARRVFERDPALGLPRLRGIFARLAAWHAWFHRDRRGPSGETLVTHPWESGRDNAPDWDAALDRVPVEKLAAYVRRDTAHVDAQMRPTSAEYDRYLALLAWGRTAGWDTGRIAAEGPFAVADPGMTFVLIRAERDLLALAEAVGDAREAARIAARLDEAETAAAALWVDEAGAAGAYCARDLRTGRRAMAVTSAAFLAWFAGLADAPRLQRLADTLGHVLDAAAHAVPSLDPHDPRFEPKRYWRGPIWAIVNWMIAHGLAEAGQTALAARVRIDTRRLIASAGFREYFDPLSGEGAGGRAFSWTAAVWLDWASPSAEG
ncbi:MAG: hypothetical protein AAGE13_15505 [Pseudomonadota bacterium]